MNSSRSWLVWGTAVAAYMVAVLQRSSLGVAGVEAAQRFELSGSVLSSLGVVQIVVYAAFQVPVGMLLDRFGPKALISTGAVLMLIGQFALAFTPDVGFALVGRVLVGAGDAATFISVLRLLSFWFSGKILPRVLQWTGNIGQLGQILSVVPFSWLLQSYGWTSAFAIAGIASAFVLGLVLLLVANSPSSDWRGDTVQSFPLALRQVREALKRPGTQLGFWSHFVSQGPSATFSLLWGFPFLVAGLGNSHELAAGLLALLVVAGFIAGPLLGIMSARFPLRRSNLVLSAVALMLGSWSVVLAWPTEPPLWLICILIFSLGVGGPGSLIGFDFARQFNPLRSLGSATGFVNVVMMLHARRRTRRLLHEEEGIQVAPLWVVWVRERKRRRAGKGPSQSVQ